MTGMTPPEAAADELSRHVTTGDIGQAHRLLQRLLEEGWTIQRLVSELLAVVQVRTGRAWQAGRRTIAQEHATTAVVDDLLGALSRLVPPPTSHANIALVCAEGEWHVTPARMAALLFRRAGWRTTFYGGSTPLGHLEQTLAASPPTFVAISCTDPRFLLGAARVGALARGLGVPSLAGGAGFGDREHRATALGITGWAPDPAAASAILHRWLDAPPDAPDPAPPETIDLTLLERRRHGVTEQAIQRLAAMAPTVLRHGAQPLEHVRRDLGELLHVAHVASACADPRVLTDFVRWLAELHPPRGLPHEAVQPSVQILRELTDRFDDGSAEVLATVGS